MPFQFPTTRQLLNLYYFCLFGSLVAACLLGCQPSNKEAPSGAASDPPPPKTEIPLRMWVVAPLQDAELVQRQWLANSEQSLEIRLLTPAELLQETRCDCDVLIYPSGMIGELIHRQWIVKLPEDVLAGEPSSEDGVAGEREPSDTPSGKSHKKLSQMQASYGQAVMGISLGNSIPVIVASDALDVSSQPLTWEAILEQLQLTFEGQPQFSFQPEEVDRGALVDRFLALVATLSQRDPGYGLMFDMQTMRSRLNEPEFLGAAKLLGALASQPQGLSATIGSHAEAWSWATSNTGPAIAIAPTNLLDSEAAGIATGQLVDIQSAESKSTSSVSVRAWNTGDGLVASISSRCRQSIPARSLLTWLDQVSTRTMLSNLLPGVDGGGGAGNESLANSARQTVLQQLTASSISLEPRLPLASEYQSALAEELVAYLQGKKDAADALAEVDRRWNEITEKMGKDQRRFYEQSLNLAE